MDVAFALTSVNIALDKLQKGDTEGALAGFTNALVSIYAAARSCNPRLEGVATRVPLPWLPEDPPS